MPDEYDALKPTLLSVVEKVVPPHHREKATLMLETDEFFEVIRDQCKTSDVVKSFVFSADKRKWYESPEEEEEMKRFIRHYNFQFSTCLGCKDPYLISMQEMCKDVEDLKMMDFFAWLVSQDRSLSAFCRIYLSGVASRFCKEKKFVLPCPGVKV